MTDTTTTSSFSMMSDDELYSFFSDFHKDVLGFRPRGDFWTRERVVEWCERETSPESMKIHLAEWALEDEYYASLNESLKTSENSDNSENSESKYEQMAIDAGF